MKRHKPFIAFVLLIIFLVLLGNFYAFKIEPYRVTKKTYTFSNNKVSDALNQYRIAFFSDVDVYDQTSLNQLKKTVKALNQDPYDLVIFGGDLFSQNVFESEQVIEQLRSIQSKSGKYAILGEKDSPIANDVEYILFQSDFEVLNNRAHRIKVNDRFVTLVGLQYAQDIQPMLNESMLGDPIITLIHTPDSFTEMLPFPFDLQLSGHSYGGFIAIPYLNLYHAEGAQTYVNGSFEKDGKRLIISNGIGGLNKSNYRFLAPPQITVVKLQAPKVIVE